MTCILFSSDVTFGIDLTLKNILLAYLFLISSRVEDVAQLVERRTGTPLRQVRFPAAARDFSLRVNIQCRLSNGVRTALLCNRMH